MYYKVKNRPFAPAFQSLVEGFFNDAPTATHPLHRKVAFPAVNVKETEAAFVLELAVPGYNKAKFAVSTEKNQLVIAYSDDASENTETYRRREFAPRNFEKRFTLSENINIAEVEATFQEGVLTVTLPKFKEETPKTARTIAVQ